MRADQREQHALFPCVPYQHCQMAASAQDWKRRGAREAREKALQARDASQCSLKAQKRRCMRAPEGAIVCAGGHDSVFIDGGAVDDGALVLQHVVQELAHGQPELLYVVRAPRRERVLARVHRQRSHLRSPNKL